MPLTWNEQDNIFLFSYEASNLRELKKIFNIKHFYPIDLIAYSILHYWAFNTPMRNFEFILLFLYILFLYLRLNFIQYEDSDKQTKDMQWVIWYLELDDVEIEKLRNIELGIFEKTELKALYLMQQIQQKL
jgi:hypothetical protein